MLKKQSFNKTIIYFYGKSIQMEIIDNIILDKRIVNKTTGVKHMFEISIFVYITKS